MEKQSELIESLRYTSESSADEFQKIGINISLSLMRRPVHVERGKHATCEPNRCMNHT